MNEPDVDLLNRVAEGNLEAFETLYRSWSGMVYAVAFRVLQSRFDAEEVTQDVFLKVHRSLRNFEGRSSFKTWVYRITMNTALSAVKRLAKDRNRRGDFETALRSQAIAPDAPKRLEQEEHEKKIQLLLAVLNPDQRACVILREIEGLNYQQIADVLDTKINTVRSRLKRARETLMARAEKGAMKHEL